MPLNRLRWMLPLLTLCVAAPARAAWFDAAWACRRTVDVAWNADAAVGGELGQVECYTDGHALPTAADVRVATEDGRPVACHVLMAGPGDRVRFAFALAKGVKRYAVYFGNPAPPPPPPGLDDVGHRAGLLIETRAWTGGTVHTFEQVLRSWDHSGPVLGQTLIAHPFLGFNPFDDRVQIISKLTGTLTAPIDGDYTLAMAVDDEAALYVDGKPVVMAHLGPADIRYHTVTHLATGPHEFVLYHVNAAGTGYFSVGWKRPDAAKVAVIEKTAFGNLFADGNVTVGPLEIKGRTLVGDAAAERVAECPVGDGYAFHYRFTGLAKAGVTVRYDWDFGDGQTTAGPAVDHVYLRDGTYPVRCAAHAGANTDVQTIRLVVGRDYLHLPMARTEAAELVAPLIATYRLSAVPPADLSAAVLLDLSANRLDAALPVAAAMASLPSPADGATALAALKATEQALLAANRPEDAVTLWDRVPASGDLRGAAAARAAELSLWWVGDAKRAVALLAPRRTDHDVRLAYAQALLLTGRADDARPLLESLPAKADGARKAALSGADARTVEFYITEGEPDAGDAAWQRWMTDFPVDYLAGYSVVLRAKLLELRHRDAAAAAVAEAFADAVPQSSYAPQLLDRASKLLAKSDPGRSAALRQQLKQKYPEDPLSQN